MSSRVSRADLLNYLWVAEWDDLSEIADCFGYKQPLVQLVNEAQPPDTELPIEAITHQLPEPALAPSLKLPSEIFYRLSDTQPSILLSDIETEDEVRMPDWVQHIEGEALDLNAPKRLAALPPAPLPLLPWAQLWPLLREILSQTQVRPRPDVKKLVKKLSNGEQLAQVPQQQRRSWTAGVLLLLDDAERLQGLMPDYQQLENNLSQLRGTIGLETVLLIDGPDEDWPLPAFGTPLLILSDLGIYEASGEVTRRWLNLGQRLKQAGYVAYALVPAALKAIPPALNQCFQCLSWDRFTVPGAMKGKRNADTLLALLSVAKDIEPRLIRALRYQLPHVEPMGVSAELCVWNHEHVERSSTHLQIKSEWRAHYRTLLAVLLAEHPELREPLYQNVKQQLVGELLVDYYEAISTTANLTGITDPELSEAAEKYLKQFVLAVHQHPEHIGMLYQGYYWLEQQSEGVKADKDYLSSLWAIIKSQTKHQEHRPTWLDDGAAQAFLSKTGEKQYYELIQVGEDFYLGTPESLLALHVEGFHREFYTLAEITTSQALVIEQRGEQKTDYYLSDGHYLRFLAGGEGLQLHIGGQCWRLDAFQRSGFADIVCGANGLDMPLQASGQDQYGTYFDLSLPEAPDIRQRFRYIPPNTFLMGSPPEEPEREFDVDETQHEVTLSQGYWMADTCVTQGFWEAVMGSNPSYFKGKNRPVDTVSWDDVQAFLKTLRANFPMLTMRLPTEAEWECACRAGTTTTFSFGENITPKQVNYNGDFPYTGGRDGLNRRKTVNVKSLPANFWGLYEMHGNLYEWCQDWRADYGVRAVIDPNGPISEERRVLRGGSWRYYGRHCRSAYRNAGTLDFRIYDIGFRFVLGHLSSGQVAGDEPNSIITKLIGLAKKPFGRK